FLLTFLHSDEDIIELEVPLQLRKKDGNIAIGRILKGKAKKQKFFLSIKDLEKHMFICGSTGTGKTNFLQHFLINFTKYFKIPFMLVEFKGEYHFLQTEIENLLIIRPGENFSINIFNPEGAPPDVHAERIFDILKSGKFLDETSEFSPQMEKVLVEILTIICRNKKLQSWEGFYEYCKDYVNKKQKEIPMLSQTLISITNRIRRFSLGSLKAIFDRDHKLKVRELFERNVLIDLSSIIRLGGEKEDALFFLNMVLKYLWDKNLTRGAYKFQGIKHITIVEDTQYFAPKDLIRQNKLTTYLEDIALLQRGTGECLISLATHPDISEEILANCGVLVCFKSHIEKEFLCKLLNLNAENDDYLSILEEGQCIVRVNSNKRPFLLHVPLIRRRSLEFSEIKKKNQLILSRRESSFNSDSKLEEDCIQKGFSKISNEVSRNAKKKYIMQGDLEKNQSKNLQQGKDNTVKKNNISKPSGKLDGYNKLESYINYLYKTQKKKE
ncbi:MAG: ATP-binding protein, partial [Candidatus Hodarchaeota archaeon]